MRGLCLSDNECIDGGATGRCLRVDAATPYHTGLCSYDDCVNDMGCQSAGGAGVCVCRDSAASLEPNRCVIGNCRTDADCNGNYCSLANLFSSRYAYYCHTKSDECVDDSDCGDDAGACTFVGSASKWRCVIPQPESDG
jgi:hypothetical protein